jgi:hypothetical protein
LKTKIYFLLCVFGDDFMYKYIDIYIYNTYTHTYIHMCVCVYVVTYDVEGERKLVLGKRE